MFHKRLARMVLAGLLAAGSAVSVMGVTAAPASAGPIGVDAGCKFILSKVTGNRLQEAPADEIYLRIGAEYTKTVKFREGETHLAAEFGTTAQTTEFISTGGAISVQVYEADFPSSDDFLGSFNVFCNAIHDIGIVDNFGSNYEVEFDVVVA